MVNEEQIFAPVDGVVNPDWYLTSSLAYAEQLKVCQLARLSEYPPITDYLDGVVKGDQVQIDAYIAACQAVKAKYPKPESV